MLQQLEKTCVAALFAASIALAQPPDFGFPGGFGGRGPGGMGGHTKILEKFDKDEKGYLNAEERKAAREYLSSRQMGGPGGPGRGGRGGRRGFGPGGFGGEGGATVTGKPGPKVSVAEAKKYGNEPLYEPTVLRTFFLEFEDADWDKELQDFYHTDVDIPAKLTVDGKVYPDVGVHYRGASSYMAVPEGGKRSLDISMHLVHDDQRLLGYRSLNLLNSNADPTFMRTALYHYVSRQYIAAPKANWVRVVINGESWGIYVNTQQINSDMAKEWYNTTKGARWKVPGSPGGRGGLAYLGDDIERYKGTYEIKSKDDPKSWKDLANLCKVLNQTAPDQLEKALAPILDVDGALKFLALDKAVINNDGFWVRASDYSIYEEPNGKFHVIPWDANETFREPEMMGGGRGRGGFGGPGGGRLPEDATLDPFAGADDPQKALLYRLLAVPSLRTRYLVYMRDIAENWLDWNKLEPIVAQWQGVIAAEVKADTRKIFSTDAFSKAVTVDNFEPGFGPTAPPAMSLKSFVEQRRKFLLNYHQ